MVLLTSSQVSVAISSAIVISFTTALFLSGYAIQQRTVRNLRAAIRPDTSPQIYLPDRFKDDTTELEDGTLVMLDEYNRPVRIKAGRYSLGEAYESEETGDSLSADGSQGQEEVRIEVTESISTETSEPSLDLSAAQDQKVMVAAEESPTGEDGGIAETTGDEKADAREAAQEDPMADAHQASAPAKPQLAPWEIRQEDLPREEAQEPVEGEEGKKLLSRAERRRLIKEEIQRLSQGDEPMYYQRRLW